MKVYFLLATFLLSSALSAKSGGNGAGNGGHGLVCETGVIGGPKVTLLRDIAENISRHYSKDYFKNRHDRSKSIIATYVDINNHKYAVPAKFQKGLDLLKKDLPLIADQVIDTELESLSNFFNYQERRLINIYKSIFINHTNYIMPTAVEFLKNYTKDIGRAQDLEKKLIKYHLYNCKEAQIAVLQSFSYDDRYKIQLILPARQLQFMDDLNLKALLWHEVLYLSVKDKDSARIRNIVSLIMGKLYDQI